MFSEAFKRNNFLQDLQHNVCMDGIPLPYDDWLSKCQRKTETGNFIKSFRSCFSTYQHIYYAREKRKEKREEDEK